MKYLFTAIAYFLLFLNISDAQKDDFVVQVAAFDQKVPFSYFKNLEGVFYVKDHNDIHKYYLGSFDSMDAARSKAKKVRGMGYQARTLNLGAIERNCANGCFAPQEEIFTDVKLKSIFFDFDRSALRTVSKRQLDMLYSLLKENSNYNAKLSAHTDSKGSDDYNQKLSLRRAEAAKLYLINRGINSERLFTSTFGEAAPIAKNKLTNGVDTETGRQFNRRVELAVYRADGQLADVVEEIEVPTQLQPEVFARKD